jgi:membrane-associated protein
MLAIVHTFAPMVTGIGTMNYRPFFADNLIGELVWTVGVTILGYFLGQVIPDLDKYLPIILMIILVSVAPSILHLYHERKPSKH